ncbi:DUF3644 domain-containing protein [Tenggerimyces flavus]|uniref:DUF3644 domain-containing protein n=1 Tax=Tenggerimyces flavus TaxID=1708749 RepID=A0ABV7YB84_9ACTN
MVAASRDEASLAVRLYNDPAEMRSFEGFVIHMHLAWLYLLHAEFIRDGVDHRSTRRAWRFDHEPEGPSRPDRGEKRQSSSPTITSTTSGA